MMDAQAHAEEAKVRPARDRRRSLMMEIRNSNFQRSVRNLLTVPPELQNSLLQQLHPDEREEELETALHGERSWQVRTLAFLHCAPVEWTLSLLLVVDLLLNFFDLYYVEPLHPDCFVIRQNAICGDGSEPTCAQQPESAAQGLVDGSSLVITCIFLAENLTLLAVLGCRHFFTNIFHAVDFLVVASSLALSITFSLLGDQRMANLVGLLLLARLWRFVSLGYGLMSAASKKNNRDVQLLQEKIQELEALLEGHGVQLLENQKGTQPLASTDEDAYVLT